MNDREQKIRKMLEYLPPHYWNMCGNLTAYDVTTIRHIVQEREHTWNKIERIEVEMLINRLNEEWREEHDPHTTEVVTW